MNRECAYCNRDITPLDTAVNIVTGDEYAHTIHAPPHVRLAHTDCEDEQEHTVDETPPSRSVSASDPNQYPTGFEPLGTLLNAETDHHD